MYTVVSTNELGSYSQKVIYAETADACYVEFTSRGDRVKVYDDKGNLIRGREDK